MFTSHVLSKGAVKIERDNGNNSRLVYNSESHSWARPAYFYSPLHSNPFANGGPKEEIVQKALKILTDGGIDPKDIGKLQLRVMNIIAGSGSEVSLLSCRV